MSDPHIPCNKLCPDIPTVDTIRTNTKKLLSCYPCLWQAQASQVILRGVKDLVVKSGTGSGKTLTFWIPLLFSPTGIQVVITPLNILGTQNEAKLAARGIKAISINGKNVNYKNIQDIKDTKYRVVIVNPEIALGAGSAFEAVWKCNAFTSRILSIIWDEAHCVSAWGSFRKEYQDAGRLRLLLNRRVPFYVASASLPGEILTDVMQRLRMHKESTVFIERSNDRPDVHLAVCRIQHALDSFEDLRFLIPNGWKPGDRLPKFLMFFDNITESHHHLIKWFNADMTPTFRDLATKQFKDGTALYGLFCTDSFGLGVDVPDIALVIQWRVTCDLNALWQRFGRAARGAGTEAVAVLFAELKYFDDTKAKAAKAAEVRAVKAAQKAIRGEKSKRSLDSPANAPTRKKQKTSDRGLSPPDATDTHGASAGVLSMYEQLRITYQEIALKNNKTSARVKVTDMPLDASMTVGPEMDHFVNAAT
ncbi:P-loop containing nucleoside triphosphate hydrolase protein [Cytidiella melzeri]|nr:P-loop containing nucleoside triphosphate hydrolase protein [Cytidiella melzeri]